MSARLAVAGLVAAGAVLVPAAPASAIICYIPWMHLTGDCTPCHTVARIADKAAGAGWDCPQG